MLNDFVAHDLGNNPSATERSMSLFLLRLVVFDVDSLLHPVRVRDMRHWISNPLQHGRNGDDILDDLAETLQVVISIDQCPEKCLDCMTSDFV